MIFRKSYLYLITSSQESIREDIFIVIAKSEKQALQIAKLRYWPYIAINFKFKVELIGQQYTVSSRDLKTGKFIKGE